MPKKYLIIIIALVLLGLMAGVLVYYQKRSSKPNADNENFGEIKKISDEIVTSPVVSYDETAIWFFNGESRLMRTDADGSGLSEFPLPALEGKVAEVLWPAQGSDFIIKVEAEPTGTFLAYFNAGLKKYTFLSDNIQDLDWLPDSRRVAYIWYSEDGNSQQLVTADADGSGFKKIKDVFWPDLRVKVSLDGKSALLIKERSQEGVNKIYRANLDSGNIETVVESGENLDVKWVPKGERFLYSQIGEGFTTKILLYNFAFRSSTDLDLQTSLEKTVVDKEGKYLYAAVPKKDNTGDVFVRIDLNSFQQESFYEPTENIYSSQLFLVAGKLYFVNVNGNKLYSIEK